MADASLHGNHDISDILQYDPETGILRWKVRSPALFKKPGKAASWNAQFAGCVAGCLNQSGYIVLAIYNQQNYAHRAAWAIMTGNWPTAQIDHINGNRSDNRWQNLREVTVSQNARNRRLMSTNTSGHNGVFLNEDGRWHANISTDSGRVSLGSYRCITKAIIARRLAEQHHGYTKNHGNKKPVAPTGLNLRKGYGHEQQDPR